MFYEVYNTDAFVISSTETGEANKLFCLFTQDLGILYAEALGVRKIDSKLKFTLQPFSAIRISVVRGKQRWRIIDASQMISVRFNNSVTPIAKSLILLKRLSGRDIVLDDLFICMKNAAEFISINELTEKELYNLEKGLVLDVLKHLGYLAEYSFKGQGQQWSRDVLSEIDKAGSGLIKSINNSIKETQL